MIARCGYRSRRHRSGTIAVHQQFTTLPLCASQRRRLGSMPRASDRCWSLANAMAFILLAAAALLGVSLQHVSRSRAASTTASRRCASYVPPTRCRDRPATTVLLCALCGSQSAHASLAPVRLDAAVVGQRQRRRQSGTRTFVLQRPAWLAAEAGATYFRRWVSGSAQPGSNTDADSITLR